MVVDVDLNGIVNRCNQVTALHLFLHCRYLIRGTEKIMEITWDVIDSHAYQFRNIGVRADTSVVVVGDHSSQSSLRDVARLALQSLGASVIEVLPTSAFDDGEDKDNSESVEFVSSCFASSDYVIDCTKAKLTRNLDTESIRRWGTRIFVDKERTWTPMGEAAE